MTSDPGVYLMKNQRSEILYIGKAKNLKTRLQQYFIPGRDGRPMVPFLTAQVTTIETIVTFSEKDALLLENTLIKRHHPKYNILLKDDKAFVSLLINRSHPYPMIKIIRYRETPQKKGFFLGLIRAPLLRGKLFLSWDKFFNSGNVQIENFDREAALACSTPFSDVSPLA